MWKNRMTSYYCKQLAGVVLLLPWLLVASTSYNCDIPAIALAVWSPTLSYSFPSLSAIVFVRLFYSVS